ncbi:MAG: chemotaxis signal transduction protein CheV [Deltaproteobacteria bacterium]|nr:chemotaxis signal transduction protein CheV [Deltaproteobacteria bacterium]
MQQTNILLETGTNELEIVEFYLDEKMPGDETPYRGYYGVNVAKVLEIINKPKRVTEMPERSHPSVLGAFNQRSAIIPLVDLSLWLGKTMHPGPAPKVIVTEFNRVVNAFLVSGVTRIHRMSWESVEPPGQYVSAFSANCITGVVKLENRILFLLDLEKVVAELNPQLALRLDDTLEWGGGDRYTALIVDDSQTVRNMLKDVLEKANFLVRTASDGDDAWKTLASLNEQAQKQGVRLDDLVQIVISDIEMPSVDGFSLTRKIKSSPEFSFLPVILFSSLITDKLRHKGLSVGADDQISKPEVSNLAIKAKKLIEERRAGAR